MKNNDKINGIHIYQGKCPDINNGPYSRDKNCQVCQALIAMEKQPAHKQGELTVTARTL